VLAKTKDQIKREERGVLRTSWEIAFLAANPEADGSRLIDY
jgi:hypothetical protein